MNLANKLVEKYNKMPNKICMIQNDRKITFKDLYFKVVNFKTYLEEQKGIKKGQKILILIPMSIVKKNEFDDITGIIGISKYLLYANVNSNLRKLKTKVNVKKIEKCKTASSLDVIDLENDFSAIYTYTSGTTGKPKIASRTHEFLNIQGEILYNNIEIDYDYLTETRLNEFIYILLKNLEANKIDMSILESRILNTDTLDLLKDKSNYKLLYREQYKTYKY